MLSLPPLAMLESVEVEVLGCKRHARSHGAAPNDLERSLVRPEFGSRDVPVHTWHLFPEEAQPLYLLEGQKQLGLPPPQRGDEMLGSSQLTICRGVGVCLVPVAPNLDCHH
jgi:hypothetical protein